MFPGGMDMGSLLQQAQQLQQQLSDAQEQLRRTHVSGSAGGGLVTATVTGAGELVGLAIAPAAVDVSASGSDPAETAETLADLVLAAVRDATERAAQEQARTMGPLTEGLGAMGGGLPGGLPGGVPGGGLPGGPPGGSGS